MAAAPGLGTLTAAGGGPLAPGTPNGVPTTVALGGLNAAAQAQAAINAAVSASALHHNPAAVLPQHTNHQLSGAVHHPAISPHLPQHLAVTAGGPQQQISTNHLSCHFTNAVESGGGPHAVSVSANSLQQPPASPRQQIHSSPQTNHSHKNNLLQPHQVTPNQQTLLHQQTNVVQQQHSQQSAAAGCGQPMQTIGPQSLQHQLTTTKQQQPHQSSPAPKKFRPSYTRPSNKSARYVPKPMPQELSNLKTYSSPDILICGNCREMFSDLIDMLDHKRDYCKLRFTCKCDVLNEECTSCDLSTSDLMNLSHIQGTQGDTTSESASSKIHTEAALSSIALSAPSCRDDATLALSNSQHQDSKCANISHSNTRSSTTNTTAGTTDARTTSAAPKPKQKYLHCVSCKSPFSNAWDLMVHVQAAHMMNIYQLADSNKLQQRVTKSTALPTETLLPTKSCTTESTSASSRSSNTQTVLSDTSRKAEMSSNTKPLIMSSPPVSISPHGTDTATTSITSASVPITSSISLATMAHMETAAAEGTKDKEM